MRSSLTIIQALVLSFGAASVAAHTVPERRDSELQARGPSGGYGFSNPLQKLQVSEKNVNIAKVSSVEDTSELDKLKARLENMGLEKVSEEILDDKVHTATYSIPEGLPITKRGLSLPTELVKRGEINMEGGRCLTACGFDAGVQHANPADCTVVYNTLFNRAVRFSVSPRTVNYYVFQNCAGFLINNTPNTTATYDHWDFGGVTKWLNGNCIQGQSAAIGTCLFQDLFGPSFESSVYSSVNHPSYFGV